MKLIELDYSDYKMYNPVKDETIVDEELFEDSESLIAYWVDEVLLEPFIKDPALKESWDDFIAKVEEETDGDTPDWEEAQKFLEEYNAPNWIVYAITSSGIACGPVSSAVWHVVDKDTLVTEIFEENMD
ncbi:MAG TPA: hypothetical protein VMV77_20880 [Bacteroidales bacterium]|nr:hypothetical protein [Bacteroidales bacterium]